MSYRPKKLLDRILVFARPVRILAPAGAASMTVGAVDIEVLLISVDVSFSAKRRSAEGCSIRCCLVDCRADVQRDCVVNAVDERLRLLSSCYLSCGEWDSLACTLYPVVQGSLQAD
jgi:hypothetical protein